MASENNLDLRFDVCLLQTLAAAAADYDVILMYTRKLAVKPALVYCKTPKNKDEEKNIKTITWKIVDHKSISIYSFIQEVAEYMVLSLYILFFSLLLVCTVLFLVLYMGSESATE